MVIRYHLQFSAGKTHTIRRKKRELCQRTMGVRIILLALAGVFVLSSSAQRIRFDNYRVISAKVETEQQREFLEQLEATSDSLQFIHPAIKNQYAEIVVAPHKIADLDELFELNGIKSEVKTTNLQKYKRKNAIGRV